MAKKQNETFYWLTEKHPSVTNRAWLPLFNWNSFGSKPKGLNSSYIWTCPFRRCLKYVIWFTRGHLAVQAVQVSLCFNKKFVSSNLCFLHGLIDPIILPQWPIFQTLFLSMPSVVQIVCQVLYMSHANYKSFYNRHCI